LSLGKESGGKKESAKERRERAKKRKEVGEVAESMDEDRDSGVEEFEREAAKFFSGNWRLGNQGKGLGK